MDDADLSSSGKQAVPVDGVHVAASVRFREVDGHRLAEVPGLKVGTDRYFELSALDGHGCLARHRTPKPEHDDSPHTTDTVVVMVHGSGSSYSEQPVLGLSDGLVSRGISVVAVNTRQSGSAVNTDNLYATCLDVGAAYLLARSFGYPRVILYGHSLGSIQVAYFAATNWSESIGGVVLSGMPADLPWKSRHVLAAPDGRYESLRNEAIAKAREGRFSEPLTGRMPWLYGGESNVTAEHFVTYRAEGLSAARSVEWVTRVPYPVLLVRDENDPVVSASEGSWMAASAASGLSPSVTYRRLASASGSNGHRFETSLSDLVSAVGDWIEQLPFELNRPK